MNIAYNLVDFTTQGIDDMKTGDVFRVSKESYDNISGADVYKIPSNLKVFLFQDSRNPNCDNVEPLMMCESALPYEIRDASYIVNLHTGKMIEVRGQVHAILKQLTFTMYDFSFGESKFSISEMRASDAANKPGELFIDFMDTDNCNVNMYKNAEIVNKTVYTTVQDALTLFPLRMCINDASRNKYYLLNISSGYFESRYFCGGEQRVFMKLDSSYIAMEFSPMIKKLITD